MTVQPESSPQQVQQRLQRLYVPIALLFFILGARLWQLQIIQGQEYAAKAEQNRVRNIQLVAPRGVISDRKGRTLVENRPSFNILLYRESMKDPAETARFVTDKLGVKPEELAARLRRNRGTALYRPIVIKEDVGIDDISATEAHKRDHPEIQLGPEPRRLYRFGSIGAHVLGYVGEVSEEELQSATFAGVRTGDLVGKAGIERSYNDSLTGQDGRRQVLVDSLGREVGLLEDVESAIGGEVQLTLDLDLQMAAEQLLHNKVGVIAAMDPRNGEILAMASSPSFDPNSFSARISAEDWNSIVHNPDRPLQNRAIQNAYSPGSIFKLIMAEAALEEGFVQEETRIYCTGAATYYDRVFHCGARGGHGFVGLEQAITWSCNIFFYEMGRRMGISRIAEHAQALGLGRPTGIDLPGERQGLVPTPEWKQRTRGAKWFAGETISVSIGQGALSATPVQMLRAIAAIAADGRVTTPHTVLRADRRGEAPPAWATERLAIPPESFRRIRAGMWGSVNAGGTGHNAAIPGMDVCGKTGTVQVIGNERRQELKKNLAILLDHSWFAGFAPRDNPEIALVAFVEHGGKGGENAAPMARELLRAYFAAKRRPELISQVRGPAGGGR